MQIAMNMLEILLCLENYHYIYLSVYSKQCLLMVLLQTNINQHSSFNIPLNFFQHFSCSLFSILPW